MKSEQDGYVLASRLGSDDSVVCLLVTEGEWRNFARIEKMESTMRKEMKRPDTDQHRKTKGLLLEVSKDQKCEFARTEKSKKASFSTMKREISTQLKALSASFNS